MIRGGHVPRSDTSRTLDDHYAERGEFVRQLLEQAGVQPAHSIKDGPVCGNAPRLPTLMSHLGDVPPRPVLLLPAIAERQRWKAEYTAAQLKGLVSHTLRKTVANFLDDAAVPTRKISDQLGRSRVSLTQDHYLGRKLTDRQTADVLEELMGSNGT